ncbi:putative RNA-binding protein [Trypanosoma theileri]|uniref:Putative RNA-binding protein n=1 Tax=Trypanosoma theileri TaxID=67003 RepID=A0A1X0NKK9_9TRYP|nr:putative RNA-binding protein [Trypanosoma theileri]ORC85304.1 putative RNA-binding protein [Trypanosoma theileri]
MSLFTFDPLTTSSGCGIVGNETSASSESRNEVPLFQRADWSLNNLDGMDNEDKHLVNPILKDEHTLMYEDQPIFDSRLGPQAESIPPEGEEEKEKQQQHDKQEKRYPVPSHQRGEEEERMIEGKDVSCLDEGKWLCDPTSSFMTPGAAGGLTTPPDSTPTTPINMMNINKTPVVNDPPRLTARNNVYLSELPSHWNTDRLRSVCLTFGGVVSAKVVHDPTTNRSREYGFVMFETEEQAALCVKTLNNRPVEGRILTCRLAHERAMPSFAHMDRAAWSSSSNTTTAAASPQLTGLTEEDLLLQQQQQQQQQKNGADGVSHPDGSSLNEETTLQRFTPLGCNLDQRGGVATVQRSRNVFIQGLPLHWNTDKLRSLCGTCGKVQLAKVVRDATTSQSCGHGFVLFETDEQALTCVERLSGFTTEGKTLICRLAREKRSSPSQLQLQFTTGNPTPSSPPLNIPPGGCTSTTTPTSTPTQCGKDANTVGMSPDYATAILQQQQQQQQSIISPVNPSFLSNAALVGGPLPPGALLPRMPPVGTPTAAIIPNTMMAPGGIPDLEYRIAAMPNFGNTYFITTLPYQTMGLGQVMEPIVTTTTTTTTAAAAAAAATTAAIATATATPPPCGKPEMMRCFPGRS